MTSQNEMEKVPDIRGFQPKQKVVIQHQQEDSLKGEVEKYDQSSRNLIVRLEKYDALKREFHKEDQENYHISYDYEVEEIIWNRKNGVLEDLKSSNVLIPNLMRKINEPTELKQNQLIEIDSYINTELDENQKEAVQKAISLCPDSEILLIQGPPGTGKTTTITEILQQILKRHKHYKILVASQSNQAVDNVLEKICESEHKIMCIGNDTSKMSKIVQNYTETKVLNTLIKQTRDRIKSNAITHQDEATMHKLQALQNEFDEKLQFISNDMLEKDKLRDNETANLFLKHHRLIFGTLLGISSWRNFRDIAFDFAIVDEAGRATLSELLVPCIKARRIVLVGDHKQLAPVIDDEISQHLENYNKNEVLESLFERLFKRFEAKQESQYLKHFYHRLVYNYRATQSICNLYSIPFYNGELRTKAQINKERKHNITHFTSSAVWIDTGKLSDRFDTQQGTGKINKKHVEIIQKYLQIILQSMKDTKTIYSIGIITPYKAQKEYLEQNLKIRREFDRFYTEKTHQDDDEKKRIDIGTIDSFQGSDRDIIIYDCVRSTKNSKKGKGGQKIDFIADEKRLNVSLSRSKKLLLIIGDKEYLYRAKVSTNENPFKKIIKFINDHANEYQIIELQDKNHKG